MLLTKYCKFCKTTLDLEQFSPSISCIGGFQRKCKDCYKISRRIYSKNNRERLNAEKREYVKKNPEKKKLADKRYYEKHKEKINTKNRTHKQENKEYFNQLDRQYYQENKEKRVQYSRDFRKNQPKKVRETYLKHKYDLTLEQYDELLKSQDYKCAICKSSSCGRKDRKILFIDHCHNTGKVRGLLCNKCNCGIGNFKDKPEFLKEAIKYLERHK